MLGIHDAAGARLGQSGSDALQTYTGTTIDYYHQFGAHRLCFEPYTSHIHLLLDDILRLWMNTWKQSCTET